MSGYVYLIRVGDLYRIGKTDNLEKKIKKLKPDELLTSIMTKEPETLEARLLRKYKSQRIPETGYLKLSKRQIKECKKQFELKGSLPHTLDAEVSITLLASFLLFLSFFTQVTINLSLQAINNSRNAYFSLSKTDGSPK